MKRIKSMLGLSVAGALFLGILASSSAQGFTVSVVDQDDNPVAGFKWLLEEDNTHAPNPGLHMPVDGDVNNNTLGIGIHKSHAPVLAAGETTASSVVIDTLNGDPLPDGRYFVSVLPFGAVDGTTYEMGGSPIDTSNQAEVQVRVAELPLKTAQISIKVFHDVAPLNNAPDPSEIDPENSTDPDIETMEGFTCTLTDQAGDIVQDAFGNKLGTTYLKTCDANGENPGTGSEPCLEPDGSPTIDQVGSGDFVTPPNGELFIYNLLPGKYGVQCEPPTVDASGAAVQWLQTTTIEGSKTIDAWVRPNEPPFLVEFGPPFWHAFFGFVKEMDALDSAGGPATTVKGEVRFGHLSRPPAITFFDGKAPEGEGIGERCIIGLNRLEAGFPKAVWVEKCEDGTGKFEIPNVPPGTYQLVIWDVSLLHIISFQTIVAPASGGVVDLGTLPTPMWFTNQEHYVYNDINKNAVRECVTEECNVPGLDEVGLPETDINIRFRDGSVYQSYPTDTVGFLPLQILFPFFHWQVAESGYARLQPTGVRVINDDGGDPASSLAPEADVEGRRVPQLQTNPGEADPNDPYARIEYGTGAILQGFQGFQGQNNKFEWGRAPWDSDVNAVVNTSEKAYFASLENWPMGAGDIDRCTPDALVPAECPGSGMDGVYNNNGGISGVLFYATTRAESDPRFAAGDGWEPGIPRVQMNLYRDVWCRSSCDDPGDPGWPCENGATTPAVYPLCPEATPGERGDGIPDDANGNLTVDYADVDNYPLGWNEDCLADPEDGTCTEGCAAGSEDLDRDGDGCFDMGDAIRVAYTDSWDDNLPADCLGAVPLEIHGTPVPIAQCAEGLRTWNQARPALFDGGYIFGPEDDQLVPGTYIVEAATPPGYELVKEEDRNVDFGPSVIPAILPPKCVGDLHEVQKLFSFLTDANGVALPPVDPDDPGNEAPFAGEMRPLCDRKKVDLGSGQNAAADFFLFTDVPRAARAVGLITDDLANELAPNKPSFVEKFSPPWINVAVFDYTGREILRTTGDEFGAFNFLAASTWAINAPIPAGVSEKMHQFCLNHPTLPDGTQDPRYRAQYSTTCYTFNFQPGKTTYLDTPVIRNAAFVGSLQQTLDCQDPSGTPQIKDVINLTTGEPAIIRTGQKLRIRSLGPAFQVKNPAYPGDSDSDGIPDDPPSEPEFITRDFGFGATEGTVAVGGFTFRPDQVTYWDEDQIEVSATPPLVDSTGQPLATGQLVVTRADNGRSTTLGITLTRGTPGGGATIRRVGPGQTYATIQAAIDAANDPGPADPADLILVEPGEYRELPIMYKRVRLQGAGAGSTIINATHYSGGPGFDNSLTAWRDKIDLLTDGMLANGEIGLLPEQDPDDVAFLLDAEGPGLMVAPRSGLFATTGARDNLARRARIDGFEIRLGDIGGGIYVNAFANRLLISNNRIAANAGWLGGGIRVGNSAVPVGPRSQTVDTSPNPELDIRFNQIRENGSRKTGGGIAIFDGASDYRITSNQLCGNFARSGGGAIAHRGFSDGGTIQANRIVFNEVFQGDQPGAGLGIGGGGGGIEVAGDPDITGGLTRGTGDVTINANLIQGNLGGAADGGGIALRNVNGDDVADNPGTPAAWHLVRVFNNIIVNNVSGLAGGGLSLQDTTRAQIIHNTFANNDSAAVGIFAFQAGINEPTTPMPGGIVSRVHSRGLQAALPGSAPTYSVPSALRRNILYQNRSFFWDANLHPDLQPNPDEGGYWDLGVLDTTTPQCLVPTQSLLTDLSVTHAATSCNYTGNNNQAGDPDFVSSYFNVLTTAAAADEGGNFVQLYYTPLFVSGDYHILATSPAIDALPTGSGAAGLLSRDFDNEVRPQGVRPDTGADERQ
jgi:hypothetical protein